MRIAKDVAERIELPTAKDFFEAIYKKAFPKTARYIHHSGGNLEEAKDIFHDALIIYYEKLVAGKLRLEKSEDVYILGIVRHLWLRKIEKQTYPSSDESWDLIPVYKDPTINELTLLKFLETAGKKCMQLLDGFYYKNRNLKNISAELGYVNEHSAAVQKYKCIEKIRKEIKQKSMTYEDFFE